MVHQGPNASTKFMNSNKRRIFRSAGGRYFVRNAEGAKQYKPKAAFYNAPGAENVMKVHANHVIPAAIRPKGLRKTRKDKGVARGARGPRYLPRSTGLFTR